MSNRNFDASVITKRLGNKAIAKSIISNFNNVNANPQTSNINASIINEVKLGNSLFVTRGPTCTTYDAGCPCPFETVAPVPVVIPQIGWFTRISGSGISQGYGVSVDSNNNIIVTGIYTEEITIYNIDGSLFGTLPGSAINSAYIVKYNSNGTAVWATRIAGVGDNFGVSVSVDSLNNIIATGFYTGGTTTIYNADGSGPLTLTLLGTNDVFIVKYNSNGTAIWATKIAGAGGNTIVQRPGRGVSVDLYDNSIIITGLYTAPTTIYNADGSITLPTLANNGSTRHTFIVKYNSNGVGIWATRIAPVTSGAGDILALCVNVVPNRSSAGDIILSGSFAANSIIYNAPGAVATLPPLISLGGTDAFLVKYNSNGTALWDTSIYGSGVDRGFGVSVDSLNNIIVVGLYVGIATILNSDGTTFGTLPNNGSNDAFIVKYDSSGVGIWATRIGGVLIDRGNGVTVDSNNNIILTGIYAGPTTIFDAPGGITATLALPFSGINDVFIVKYDSNGVGIWATRIAGAADDTGNSITVDSNNNILVTGFYSSNPVTIYNTPGGITDVAGTLINTGLVDAFLVKYTSSGFAN